MRSSPRAARRFWPAKPDQEISNDLSWRRGVLVFNQQTLADAAEQFNRYNSRHILVEGSARKIRIGGSFKADNVDVFVQLLHRGLDCPSTNRMTRSSFPASATAQFNAQTKNKNGGHT